MSSIIDALQALYNKKRTPTTWGAPEVSRFFFSRWREKGLVDALLYLTERERELGNPKIPAVVKTGMNIVGCLLLILGVETTKTPLRVLKSLMYGLLFAACGGGGSSSSSGDYESPEDFDRRRERETCAHDYIYDLAIPGERCTKCGDIIIDSESD